MILILATSAENPGSLVREVVKHIQAAGEECLLATVPSLFLRYENSGRTKILHHRWGMIEPDVVFHWVGGGLVYSALDALELCGFRLINPVKAWRIGRDKSM